MDPHQLAERRSLLLHRAIADRLRADPSLLLSVAERVEDWRRRGLLAPPYADAWARLLEAPLAELIAVMISDTERARALRQSTPFVGIIKPRERWRLWKEAGQGG